MEYKHNSEQADEYSDKAILRLKRENLSRTPHNYEVWYVYYSGQSPEITKAINALVKNKQDITEQRCHDLYKRFISNDRAEKLLKETSEKMNSTIESVSGVVSDVKDSSSDFGGKIDDLAGDAANVDDPEELKKMLGKVVAETNEMVEKNKVLEQELDKSTENLQEMRKDLDEIRKEAMTDGLTGLSNRKTFDEELAHIVEGCRANDGVFSLLIMDIDHFKKFNDDYGHQIGDQVLRLVARTITDGIKGRDTACRYGGEEFTVILPDTPLMGAEKVAESLRAAVGRKELVNRSTGDKLGQITISVGVAQFAKQEEIEDLIERADTALYTAKNSGRNRVCSAPTIVKVKSKKEKKADEIDIVKETQE